jgi:hypothetical protein
VLAPSRTDPISKLTWLITGLSPNIIYDINVSAPQAQQMKQGQAYQTTLKGISISITNSFYKIDSINEYSLKINQAFIETHLPLLYNDQLMIYNKISIDDI